MENYSFPKESTSALAHVGRCETDGSIIQQADTLRHVTPSFREQRIPTLKRHVVRVVPEKIKIPLRVSCHALFDVQ